MQSQAGGGVGAAGQAPDGPTGVMLFAGVTLAPFVH